MQQAVSKLAAFFLSQPPSLSAHANYLAGFFYLLIILITRT